MERDRESVRDGERDRESVRERQTASHQGHTTVFPLLWRKTQGKTQL